MKGVITGLLCLAALLAGLLMGCEAQRGNAAQAEDERMVVEITAFNVGKADAILVRVGEKLYLIDAGLEDGFGDLARALERENVTHLDGVFLTHVDKDHGGGMEALAATDIAIDAFYASPYFFKRTMKENQIVRAAEARGMDVIWLNEGDAVEIAADCRFEVLGPLGPDPEDENNNSLVMKLVTPEGCALLAGDMEKDVEKLLVAAEADLSAVYLKVGHHGRADATGKDFVRAVSPEIAVISTDRVEEPRSADEKVIARLEKAGAQVYVTEDYERGVKVRLEGGHAVYVSP
ncbi:MAG: MBL fold metallo-hydrolase [Clostridia bacterium]|nr:MBL fold metallo-hydrolase [Clostridia bacterium]